MNMESGLNKYGVHRLIIATALPAIVASTTFAGELSGRVRNLKGEPIAGATVFINTAGPREGVAIFCPSCYLDCGKKATTDAEGRFTLDDVDPSLVFNLVATADGYRAGVTKKWVDPAKEPAFIDLEPLPTELPPERVLRGRLVDADQKPVVGAEVRPFGARPVAAAGGAASRLPMPFPFRMPTAAS